ncbi:MAG: L-histidine N(alpha)-methyltransferase [Rhodospirillales bacterium]|nr:L-histidine N(alpha)-methyltransferase [Rhodospirillales bacterium]
MQFQQPKNILPTGENGVANAPVAILRPIMNVERKAHMKASFYKAFMEAVKGEGQGCLLQYLYYDTKQESWGSNAPPEGSPWDNLVISDNFSTWKQQSAALTHALRGGLADKLPAQICYHAYAPGEQHAIEKNDFLLIDSLQRSGKEITGVLAFDILERYAYQAANQIFQRFNLHSLGYQADILLNGSETILKAKQQLREAREETIDTAAPVIAVFGGLLQNVQQMAGQNGDEETIKQYKKIRELHGENAHLIMTVDTHEDPSVILSNYSYSQDLEAFVLNFLPRAVEAGIIQNKNYNVFANWKMADPHEKSNGGTPRPAAWHQNEKALYLHAECKSDHVIETPEGNIAVQAGKSFISATRTRKGPASDHVEMLNKAGFANVTVYEQPNQAHKVIHAAVRPA